MLKILLDMNLSPELVGVFKEKGFETVHWSTIGKYDALDSPNLSDSVYSSVQPAYS